MLLVQPVLPNQTRPFGQLLSGDLLLLLLRIDGGTIGGFGGYGPSSSHRDSSATWNSEGRVGYGGTGDATEYGIMSVVIVLVMVPSAVKGGWNQKLPWGRRVRAERGQAAEEKQENHTCVIIDCSARQCLIH